MANISYDRILLVNKKGNIIRIDENGKQYNTSIKELTEHFQELFWSLNWINYYIMTRAINIKL